MKEKNIMKIKNMINNKNGITLIALVITIIVMLILVAVTISIAVNGGLFSYAGKATSDTEIAKQEELMLAEGKVHINNAWYNSMDDYINNGEGFSDIYTETKEYKAEGDTYTAVIPAGFARGVTEGINTVDGGLVIQDKDGNQFVWIPVEYNEENKTDANNNGLYDSFEAVFYRSAWSNNARGTNYTTSTSYTEPYASGYEGEDTEYYNMMKSVQDHKGFYIGRYEAGIPIEESSRNYTLNGVEQTLGTNTMVVKRDCYPYNCVPWGSSMTVTDEDISTTVYGPPTTVNFGYGAVYLSKKMYKDNPAVTSTLCYGVQWDAMLDFIKDNDHNVTSSADWGNCGNTNADKWKITRTTAQYYKNSQWNDY